MLFIGRVLLFLSKIIPSDPAFLATKACSFNLGLLSKL